MILEKIITSKRKEVEEARAKCPEEEMARRIEPGRRVRSLEQALKNPVGGIALIAEIKRASPSRGLIARDFNPLAAAQIYQDEGASAVSVLTDAPFFGGSLAVLNQVRQAVRIPVLRKDFLIDLYQVYESAASGADSVLLIVRVLEGSELGKYVNLVHELGMEALVEVHNEEELERAVQAGAKIVGINNRDLSTMEVDTSTCERLIPHVPKGVWVVCESGIRTHAQILRLKSLGAHGVLIGEAFMEALDLRGRVREIVHGPH
ncbi:MAG: indole-3-glycerol phosphate synthase TrpC [Candidatus Omnitrophica bacterium]|nr:indole-3-glycerol phosphate synthase TrpC [Candidatus Omnitrophota bacterium]